MAVTWKKLAYEEDVITKAALTAKGDLISASAAATPAILGVGANGTVLTANDAEASGIEWAAPGAPGAHKDSHDPEDGGDALDTAAAAEIAGVQAAAEGSSHSFARADHAHQIQHGISDNHLVTIDSADVADDEYARFTASGLESRTPTELAGDLKLNEVGAPDGAVDFNGQEATDIVLEKLAAPPVTPVVGKVYLDTDDLAAYICTSAA